MLFVSGCLCWWGLERRWVGAIGVIWIAKDSGILKGEGTEGEGGPLRERYGRQRASRVRAEECGLDPAVIFVCYRPLPGGSRHDFWLESVHRTSKRARVLDTLCSFLNANKDALGFGYWASKQCQIFRFTLIIWSLSHSNF